MNGASVRYAADLERLRALAGASHGRIALAQPPQASRLVLEVGFTTAGSRLYPLERQTRMRVVIELPPRYPFQPPAATVTTPIFHPNVYPSGVVCLGAKWLPSEGMDLYVQRLVRLLTFDPLLVNVHSPADPAALGWYLQARQRHPHAFPTDRVEMASPRAEPSKPRWEEVGATRVIRSCPNCGRKLRLPAGERGQVRCPVCAAHFQTET